MEKKKRKPREYKTIRKEMNLKAIVCNELLELMFENAIDEHVSEVIKDLIVYMDKNYSIGIEDSDWDVDNDRYVYECELSRKIDEPLNL